MKDLLAAAAGFAGTVVAGFLAGVAAGRATGSSLWPLAGLFAGIVLGAVLIVRALRSFIAAQR